MGDAISVHCFFTVLYRFLPANISPAKYAKFVKGSRFIEKAAHQCGFDCRHDSPQFRWDAHLPLTMPNHARINGATLRTICHQSGIGRKDFLKAFEDA